MFEAVGREKIIGQRNPFYTLAFSSLVVTFRLCSWWPTLAFRVITFDTFSCTLFLAAIGREISWVAGAFPTGFITDAIVALLVALVLRAVFLEPTRLAAANTLRGADTVPIAIVRTFSGTALGSSP